MEVALDKDPLLLRSLDRLRERLGPNAFVIADHWEADLCAVGIASPRDPGVLAYISTYAEAAGRFYVELELPPEPGAKFPYQVSNRHNGLDFEQLVHAVAGHLARVKSGPAAGGEKATP